MNLSPEDHVPPNACAGRRTGAAPRGRPLHFTFDGREVLAYEGETVAAALLAAGQRVLRLTGRRGEPRGLFCGMGVCFDCLVQVDGRPNVRACQTPAAEGLRVETQRGAGSWEVPP
jgi:predicted molibdopterin-dependent oxidoreductase YjgC